jgi:hypothetical protein
MSKPVWDKPTRMPLIPRIISGLFVVGILAGLGFWVVDLTKFERENAVLPPPTDAQLAAARPRARAAWNLLRANLTTRLHQVRPLDLGAVWSTRTGQICGLVNGRGSFGGLTGMVRFYSVQHTPVFHQLHAGTEETGFCGTELGKRRCYTVRIRDRVRTIEN